MSGCTRGLGAQLVREVRYDSHGVALDIASHTAPFRQKLVRSFNIMQTSVASGQSQYRVDWGSRSHRELQCQLFSPLRPAELERKRLILKVALRIIGRDGLVKLSMRTLAAEAEIPLGALGYYFSSKEQLIREAFETHLVNELHRVVRTVSSIGEAGSPEDLARVLAEFVIEGLQDSDHSLIAEYEFIVEASRRGELARESSAWQQSLRTQLLMTFERFGSSDPETDARLTLAVLGQVPWSGVTNILRE